MLPHKIFLLPWTFAVMHFFIADLAQRQFLAIQWVAKWAEMVGLGPLGRRNTLGIIEEFSPFSLELTRLKWVTVPLALCSIKFRIDNATDPIDILT